MITINSFGTELSKDDRVKLFPTCGKLNPEGLAVLAKADEYDQVKAVAEYYAVGDEIFVICMKSLSLKGLRIRCPLHGCITAKIFTRNLGAVYMISLCRDARKRAWDRFDVLKIEKKLR